MLQVFDAENKKADVVGIEAAFSRIEIPMMDSVQHMIQAIDGGQMVDTATFKDRFGVTF